MVFLCSFWRVEFFSFEFLTVEGEKKMRKKRREKKN